MILARTLGSSPRVQGTVIELMGAFSQIDKIAKTSDDAIIQWIALVRDRLAKLTPDERRDAVAAIVDDLRGQFTDAADATDEQLAAQEKLLRAVRAEAPGGGHAGRIALAVGVTAVVGGAAWAIYRGTTRGRTSRRGTRRRR